VRRGLLLLEAGETIRAAALRRQPRGTVDDDEADTPVSTPRSAPRKGKNKTRPSYDSDEFY